MTHAYEPEHMHAISDDTRDTVDEVLHYARRRALFEDIPLDKPMSPRDLVATGVGLDHGRRHRRAARASACSRTCSRPRA